MPGSHQTVPHIRGGQLGDDDVDLVCPGEDALAGELHTLNTLLNGLNINK